MNRLVVILAIFAVACWAVASAQTYTFDANAASTPTVVGNVRTTGRPFIAATVTPSSVDDDSDDVSDDDSDDLNDSDDTDSSDSEDSGPLNGRFTLGSIVNVTSTIRSTYANRIGSALGTAPDTACYREAHIAKSCPTGYDKSLGTCWAQCPFSYPVECGMECVRQNDDCALEIVSKVASIAQSALSVATYGAYGEFKLMAKGIQTAFKCGKEMMGLVKSMSKYVRTVKVNDPNTTTDRLTTMLYQTDNVVFDIPITIVACLGIKVDEMYKIADRMLNTVELAIKEIIANGAAILSSWTAFTGFMKNITLGESIEKLNKTEITSLQSALESNSTCGYDMKRLLDRTWMTVAELRRLNPGISEDDIRVIMAESNLVLNEIPIATNNCMGELIEESDKASAYKTRDALRKTFSGILDDLISSGTSKNGSLVTAADYAYKIADKALTFYAVWERKNIGGVVSEFFQTICGPTEFVGEIDDGTAKEALGLSMVGKAFNHSSGSWTKEGDGIVTITFHSTDTEDVSVNIKSGGNKFAEVAVAAGKSVTWKSNVTALGGKTLYLDRWRPGFLGLPGTGGGSLLLWVPRSTKGGHLDLEATLNVS